MVNKIGRFHPQNQIGTNTQETSRQGHKQWDENGYCTFHQACQKRVSFFGGIILTHDKCTLVRCIVLYRIVSHPSQPIQSPTLLKLSSTVLACEFIAAWHCIALYCIPTNQQHFPFQYQSFAIDHSVYYNHSNSLTHSLTPASSYIHQ